MPRQLSVNNLKILKERFASKGTQSISAGRDREIDSSAWTTAIELIAR